MIKNFFRGRRNKNNCVVAIIGILVCFITVGFASLATALSINGSATIAQATWNVYFDNIRVFGGSQTPTTAANISGSDKTTIGFNVTLSQPNQYYKFLVDVKNEGTIDAMVKTIAEPTVSENLEFSATYKDGTAISQNDSLKHGETKTLLVTLKYKDSAATSTTTSNVTYTLNYGQADVLAKEPTTEYTVNDLINLSNGPTTTTYESNSVQSEMYGFAHSATSQLAANVDYRYIGKSPQNYITFNGEKWRIIGIFPTDNGSGTIQNRIKIMRDASFVGVGWDSNKVNDWTNATLQKLLNSGDYYNRANTYASNGLDATAKGQIAAAKYYLGGWNSSSISAENFYTYERGTNVYSGRPTYWTGLVGLMYPSDYVYTYANGISNACFINAYGCDDSSAKTSGWMFYSSSEWTISPYSNNETGVFSLSSSGYVNKNNSIYTSNAYSMRPVVYLKSDIKLSGSGTSTDPYVIK